MGVAVEISSRVAGVGTSGAVCIQTIFFSFAPYRVRSNSHYYLSFENKLLDLFPRRRRRPTPPPPPLPFPSFSFADNNFHAHDPLRMLSSPSFSSNPLARPDSFLRARHDDAGYYTALPIFIIYTVRFFRTEGSAHAIESFVYL